MKWSYGDSWERFPIEPGEVWGLPDGSRVAVHNLFDPLPDWMRADLLFVDPPWTLGNINSFYTKAGRSDYLRDFSVFADVLFRRIAEIAPRTAYIEIGNRAVAEWEQRLLALFPHVQRWPVTYYRRHPTNLLRGSLDGRCAHDYTGMDEARCIQAIARDERYQCIADPCMGRGQVGEAAYLAGHRFVGTELNKRRLACLLARLAGRGAAVSRLDNQRQISARP